VIVMPNLYGDILSDVAAQIAGSVGLAGSSNIGEHGAMFEAIHGSAPRRAGQNLANPSGLLLGGVMMLVHIQQQDVAERVHNAWLRTLEDGVHTYDIFDERVSKQKVGTKEFARAVVERLGQKPQTLKAVTYKKDAAKTSTSHTDSVQPDPKRQLVGVDVSVAWPSRSPEALAERAKLGNGDGLTLTMVDNRGVKVWPDGMAETFCTDSFRCRYASANGQPITQAQMLGVLQRVAGAGLDIVQTVSLQNFEGKSGFTLAQGQ
jgi:isocitrate dehydrogenase